MIQPIGNCQLVESHVWFNWLAITDWKSHQLLEWLISQLTDWSNQLINWSVNELTDQLNHTFEMWDSTDQQLTN
jgi:hypothetical protein